MTPVRDKLLEVKDVLPAHVICSNAHDINFWEVTQLEGVPRDRRMTTTCFIKHEYGFYNLASYNLPRLIVLSTKAPHRTDASLQAGP